MVLIIDDNSLNILYIGCMNDLNKLFLKIVLIIIEI